MLYRDDVDDANAGERRKHLVRTLDEPDFEKHYVTAYPEKANRYSLRPSDVSVEYKSWPTIAELCEVSSNGLMEKRGGALIDIDKQALETRMRAYFDKSLTWSDAKSKIGGLAKNMARFDANKAREKLLARGAYEEDHLLRYSIRPFETRWCYYSEIRPLWNEPRPTLWHHFGRDNLFLVTRPAGVANPEGRPVFFTRLLGDNDSLRGHAYYFPLLLRTNYGKDLKDQNVLFEKESEGITANLSKVARDYLEALGFADSDIDVGTGSLIWYHALAVGHAPEYLSENVDGIRQNFPRIPLPADRDMLTSSAALGKRVARLLDTERELDGVTVGNIDHGLRTLAVVTHDDGRQLMDDDFKLTAGWGHVGKGGVTMPGKGRAEDWGDAGVDVYLNDHVYWSNVPKRVWDYYIGGYQVVKKWLSYREFGLLRRAITLDEVQEVTNMVRRIAALISMEGELNENYEGVKTNTYQLTRSDLPEQKSF